MRKGVVKAGSAAGVAAAAAMAAVAWVHATGRPGQSDDDVGRKAGYTLVRDGVTYRREPTSPAAASVDGEDGRRVTIYALDIEHTEQAECSSFDPQARLVAESDTTVRIATSSYAASSGSDGTRTCGWVRSEGEPGSEYAALRVELAKPLGDRRLVDDRSGKDIGVLDPDYVPTPLRLPAGFAEEWSHPYGPEAGFVALKQFLRRSDASLIEVRVRSRTAWSQSGEVTGHTVVGGAAATVTDEHHERCVTWSPKAGVVAEVCSLTLGDAGFLPAEELLGVARSLPPLRG